LDKKYKLSIVEFLILNGAKRRFILRFRSNH